jgi:hypothetical protein
MSQAYSARAAAAPVRYDIAAAARDWLGLAAAPTFAFMALVTAIGGEPQLLCSAARLGSPLDGMVVMYLLMGAFHAGPWLKLISARLTGAGRA